MATALGENVVPMAVPCLLLCVHPMKKSSVFPRTIFDVQRMVAKSESPVGRWFIPLFIGFQHVSTIQGDKGFLPSTVVIDNLAKDWDHPLTFSKG